MKALITGASSGIGLEFAHQLGNKGWEVYGVARSEARLKDQFQQGKYLCADLNTESGIEGTIQLIQEQSFDLLVNNAGFGLYSRFTDSSIQRQLQMMHLNMDALVRLSHAYLQHAKQGDGLINISSALSLLPMPGSAVYSGTKAFVTAFTECLWYEYKQKGIYILADLPGPVATSFHDVAGGSSDSMDSKLTLSPQEVVSEALNTYNQRKKPLVVNGLPFKLFTRFGQMMSHKWRLNTMAKNGPVSL